MPSVPVNQTTWAVHRNVVQNAWSAPTVLKTQRASRKRAGIHVQALVAKTLIAKSSITILCAAACQDTLEIHSSDALKNVRIVCKLFI